jgi:glycine/sarcosine N-methyltransferase
VKTNEEFFDSVSSFYDKMINFDAAIARRKEALSNFVKEGMTAAADLGCGTGLDSIALSLIGLNVTAFDISAKMIEQAELNAKIYNTEISFYQAGLDEIPSAFSNHFDLIVSLGNTLANLDNDHLKEAAGKSFEMLRAGSSLLVQILNFDLLRSANERIINITSKEDHFYIRFYDFLGKEVNFNILKFNSSNPSQRELITTTLYAYTPDELKELLSTAGYSGISFYENFAGKEFRRESSKDLIILAVK